MIDGVIGAVVAALFFDWALNVLSSLPGGTMITRALPLVPVPSMLIFINLLAVGLFIQAAMLKDQPEREAPRRNKIN